MFITGLLKRIYLIAGSSSKKYYLHFKKIFFLCYSMFGNAIKEKTFSYI